jgi:exodeoxyribonuclease VII small subunit
VSVDPGQGRATSFEEAMAELERIVARLEDGSTGLDEALAMFERGQQVLAFCRSKLTAAEARLEELTAQQVAGPGQGASPEAPLF